MTRSDIVWPEIRWFPLQFPARTSGTMTGHHHLPLPQKAIQQEPLWWLVSCHDQWCLVSHLGLKTVHLNLVQRYQWMVSHYGIQRCQWLAFHSGQPSWMGLSTWPIHWSLRHRMISEAGTGIKLAHCVNFQW